MLDKVLNGRGANSINQLIANFDLLELLAEEPLKNDFAERILAVIYRKRIEASVGPFYPTEMSDNSEINQVMLMRLKFAVMN